MIATAITSSAILAECQPVAGQWCQRSSHPEMPATDLNPGSPRSAREEISLNIIEEAIDIFARMKSLTGEVTEHQMSLQCSNIHAFGIAQALHCSIQAGNLSPDLDVREVLEEVYRIDCASRARTGINRYRTLKALMKMGLIDPNAHPKTLRPLNSVPRPEVVLAYIALKRNTAVSLIVDRGRAKPVLAARFEAIWAMRTICGMVARAGRRGRWRPRSHHGAQRDQPLHSSLRDEKRGPRCA